MEDKFAIEKLGPCRVPSPIHLGTEPGDLLADFTPDDARALAEVDLDKVMAYVKRGETPPAMELAGPRQYIYFNPEQIKVGVVTCGGLCPGLNNIIRALVMTTYYGYGIRSILGFTYGYAGLNPKTGHEPLALTPELVRNIDELGGTILGTSRGPQPPEAMADTLERLGVKVLFAVGGDGTFRGALALSEETKRRGLDVSVIGIPKTIDNDIPLVDRTFGFETAVHHAAQAIRAAYAEARSAENGIGLVRLMGRHSGFIAANAALAMRNVNLVLIPELPFDLEGENGIEGYLERRFKERKSTVIVVAEGAGQQHLAAQGSRDASGNVRLGDIGVFLKEWIERRFAGRFPLTLKYIDPSYIIRSQPANSNDAVFCGYLAQAAVHAGMSGRTAMAVGRSHRKFTHIPLRTLVAERKQVDPESDLWLSVLQSTGQPFCLVAESTKRFSRMSFAPAH